MASESEQGHVGCTAKRRTRLARPAFVGRSVKSLTNSNRRIRNRTYGGVGGADERLSPLPRSRLAPPQDRVAHTTTAFFHRLWWPILGHPNSPQKTMVCPTED